MGQYLCSLINHVIVAGLRVKARRAWYKIKELWAALRSRLAAAACEATGKVPQHSHGQQHSQKNKAEMKRVFRSRRGNLGMQENRFL